MRKKIYDEKIKFYQKKQCCSILRGFLKFSIFEIFLQNFLTVKKAPTLRKSKFFPPKLTWTSSKSEKTKMSLLGMFGDGRSLPFGFSYFQKPLPSRCP